MTDRWLKRRLWSPWSLWRQWARRNDLSPAQIMVKCSLSAVCRRTGVREWRQTGLAPQHTARTRTHAPGNNITRRTARQRQARVRGNAQHGRVALAVLPQPTTANWNWMDGGDDSRDRRATDRRTDRQTNRLAMIIIIFDISQPRTFVSCGRAVAVSYTRCIHAVCQYRTLLAIAGHIINHTLTTTDRRRKLRHRLYLSDDNENETHYFSSNFKLY